MCARACIADPAQSARHTSASPRLPPSPVPLPLDPPRFRHARDARTCMHHACLLPLSPLSLSLALALALNSSFCVAVVAVFLCCRGEAGWRTRRGETRSRVARARAPLVQPSLILSALTTHTQWYTRLTRLSAAFLYFLLAGARKNIGAGCELNGRRGCRRAATLPPPPFGLVCTRSRRVSRQRN